MKKNIQAIAYVVLGIVTATLATFFVIYMYFSGTFLPYKYFLRKILYIVSFIVMIISIWFVNEGYKYLQRKIKRR